MKSKWNIFVRNVFQCILLISYDFACAEYDSCPTSNSATPYVKLKDSVLCMYDNSVRPVANHQNSTAITFRVILKYFNYEVMSSTLSVDAWMPVSWKDEHLTWNPADHSNIKMLHLHTNEIWTPDLSVYNRANQGDEPLVLGSVKCAVSNDGTVLCVPPIHIDSLCIPDLTRYPYDMQNCSIRFGSWVHRGEELNILLIKRIVNMDTLIPNGEWEIVAYNSVRNPGVYKCCPNSSYPSVDINFQIKRLPGSHAASVIIPTIVVVILTFVLLSLSPMDKERLILAYVNLIAQFLQLQFVTWQIPLRGDNIPLLILFGRDSLLLSAFAILFTILFKKIMERKATPPSCLSNFISLIISNKPGQVILLSDYSVKGVASAKGEEDGTVIVNSESNMNTQDWILLGKILDKLFFLTYVIVYFIMIVSFIP